MIDFYTKSWEKSDFMGEYKDSKPEERLFFQQIVDFCKIGALNPPHTALFRCPAR